MAPPWLGPWGEHWLPESWSLVGLRTAHSPVSSDHLAGQVQGPRAMSLKDSAYISEAEGRRFFRATELVVVCPVKVWARIAYAQERYSVNGVSTGHRGICVRTHSPDTCVDISNPVTCAGTHSPVMCRHMQSHHIC